MLVTATGMATEVGAIGLLMESVAPEPTPLERRLDALGHRLVWLALGVAAVVAALGLRQGMPWPLVFETAIALAVAAVPEALPAVATIALAVGVHRMARRNALVRRLPAVEALGSTTVVCTDKTRTLTSGDMRVARIWAGHDHAIDWDRATPLTPRLRRALKTAVLASRDQAERGGDPVDLAMLMCGERFGIERSALERAWPFAALVPFSSEQKLQASFHHAAGGLMAFVKGAPRQVLMLCARGVDGRVLDERARGQLMAVNDAMAGAGLRVIALASGAADAADVAALGGLQFDGFAGLIDPPAPGVKETIARLREAGLRTVMLTGDQRLTALAVGQELGLLPSDAQILDGRDLLAMSPGDLSARVGQVNAYSRVTPADKLAIVTALQAGGAIVAMLGDGVNDAAALKRADIGVSMGRRGTDVAKEASSIILQDDRFETVAAAVEEGRVIFDNIRKFVFYLFSCNVAEILVLLIAGLAAWPMPLLPLQLLWLNMVTDTFPALALAMEPGDPRVMQRPPRDPNQAIMSRRFLAGILFYALLIAGATLAAFHWTLGPDPSRAQTAAFMTLALSQSFHLVNARSRHAIGGAAHLSNPYAIAGVLLAVALQLAAAFLPPLAAVLHVVPLTPADWAVVAGASLLPAVAGQALKSLRRSTRMDS